MYSIILTNEKGVRSYIYILKIFEKININEIISDNEKNSYRNSVQNNGDISGKFLNNNIIDYDDKNNNLKKQLIKNNIE